MGAELGEDTLTGRFREEGWIRMSPLPASPEFEVPDVMWIAWFDPAEAEGGVPLRAEPSADAEVLGYFYPGLGFVPADVVAAGTFDVEAERAARECDWTVQECRTAAQRAAAAAD